MREVIVRDVFDWEGAFPCSSAEQVFDAIETIRRRHSPDTDESRLSIDIERGSELVEVTCLNGLEWIVAKIDVKGGLPVQPEDPLDELGVCANLFRNLPEFEPRGPMNQAEAREILTPWLEGASLPARR